MIVREIGAIIGELKRERLSFILVEQNLSLALGAVETLTPSHLRDTRRDSNPNVRALELFEPREIPVVRAARSRAPTRASPAARPSASAVSDGELLALAERGLSLRRIAREAGLSHETVRQRLRR